MEDKGLRVNMDKTKILVYRYIVRNLFRVESLAASGRVVSVVKGLAKTQFFAHSMRSGYIRDVVE